VREYGLLGVTKQKIYTRKEFYWKYVICYYTHCTETMYTFLVVRDFSRMGAIMTGVHYSVLVQADYMTDL